MVDAQNVLKDHGVTLCTFKTMSNNLIGSNKSSGKTITGSLGFDDVYIKVGINWDLNQTKMVDVNPQLSYDVISNEFKKNHQIFMRVILNLMMKQQKIIVQFLIN